MNGEKFDPTKLRWLAETETEADADTEFTILPSNGGKRSFAELETETERNSQ